MSANNGASRADTLVKVVLVFFISLLSFSVGTFVGKQVSDSDHRRLALEGDSHAGRNVASSDHGDASEKITEKEVESLTEEFINKEKNAHAAANTASDEHEEKVEAAPKAEAMAQDGGYKSYQRGSAKTAEAPAVKEDKQAAAVDEKHEEVAPKKTAAAPTADATHKIADKVANNVAPTDGVKEDRKPSSALPSVASSSIGKYTVQVASYAEEKEAKGHAAGLKGKGWNAFYLPANINGRTWYRVLVGLFNNSKSANEFRAQFMKEANTKSAIVQKIVQ